MIEGRATARYVRTSAQKAKLVLDLIRGHDVNRALATLRFARKGIAHDIAKVLRSAISNAQQKEGAGGDVDRLYVGVCYADQGPSLKRIRAAPMGRAFRITKRTSHLTVMVRERPEKTVVVQVETSKKMAPAALAPRGGSTAAPSGQGEKRGARKASSRRDSPSKKVSKKKS